MNRFFQQKNTHKHTLSAKDSWPSMIEITSN
jgi:hypothetical protein